MAYCSARNILTSLLLIAGVALVGCDDGVLDANDPDQPTVEVSASFSVNPSSPQMGDQVTLDGTSSTVSGAPGLSYAWTLTSPSGSSSTLQDAESSVTTFTADTEGSYDISLVVSAGGATDRTTRGFDVVALDVVELSGTITENTTLTATTLYRVVGNVRVSSGTLTIEPGTVIEFEEGTLLRFDNGTVIVADGTAAEPILFTGTQQTPGWWQGIWLEDTQNPNNVMDHVTIEYGGSETMHSSAAPANLLLGRNLGRESSLALTNSTLRHSGGWGLLLFSGSDLLSAGNNTYTQNATAPAGVFSDNLHYLDSSSTFTGNLNGNDFVTVSGNSVTADVTWPALDVPFDMAFQTDVHSNLAIAAGAQFAFRFEAGLVFREGSVIRAQGTADAPIVFTGMEQTPGWWQGIWLEDTSNPNNVMDHVVVEYGGRSAFHSSTQPANLTFGRNLGRISSLAITNSTFRHSSGTGVYVYAGSSLAGSQDNTFTQNETSPIELSASEIHQLDGGSSFTGNAEGNDFVSVAGNTAAGTVSWQALDVPYRMDNRTSVEADLTIDPGATFAFALDASLVFRAGSVVRAEGTAANPIVFTGAESTKGWWQGIWLEDTPNPNNTMSNVVIAYGGRSAFHGSLEPANLALGRSLGRESSLDLTDSTLRDSAGHGLFAHADSSINGDVCSGDGNTFNANEGPDCELP